MISWNAHIQEIEFRALHYVNKNVGFINCHSDEVVNLLEINWNNIVCLDVKFETFSITEEKYEKYFQYIKKFLSSDGKKVFHPQIIIDKEKEIDVKEFINYLNKLLDLKINKKNLLELYVLFNCTKTFRWEDSVIIELTKMINYSKFDKVEKNIQKKFKI
jgi:hypothetical protein